MCPYIAPSDCEVYIVELPCKAYRGNAVPVTLNTCVTSQNPMASAQHPPNSTPQADGGGGSLPLKNTEQTTNANYSQNTPCTSPYSQDRTGRCRARAWRSTQCPRNPRSDAQAPSSCAACHLQLFNSHSTAMSGHIPAAGKQACCGAPAAAAMTKDAANNASKYSLSQKVGFRPFG